MTAPAEQPLAATTGAAGGGARPRPRPRPLWLPQPRPPPRHSLRSQSPSLSAAASPTVSLPATSTATQCPSRPQHLSQPPRQQWGFCSCKAVPVTAPLAALPHCAPQAAPQLGAAPAAALACRCWGAESSGSACSSAGRQCAKERTVERECSALSLVPVAAALPLPVAACARGRSASATNLGPEKCVDGKNSRKHCKDFHIF